MLDINLIRKDSQRVKEGIKTKNADPALVDKFLKLDEEWRELVKKTDEARAKLNVLSKKIAAPGGSEPRPEGRDEAKKTKEGLKKLEAGLPELEKSRLVALRAIPNLPLPEAPIGKDEKGNATIREVGKKPSFGFPAKDYLAIAQSLDLIDTERAAKVSGSRFGYIKNAAARLEFALIQMALDFLTNEKNIKKLIKQNGLNIASAAFSPIVPPVLIKPEAMEGMGYTERGGEEIYFIEKDNLYLVGTSEQSIGPMHMNEVFDKKTLPKRYISFSTCFRREAGSYGKDTKGILRVHQFDKLEMFIISSPETSAEEHKLLLAIEEELMKMLGLPYRVLQICTGDLGDPAASKYDIEAWMPAQNNGEYRETHSCSNTTDYQARRLNIKTRPDNEFVHMLNGTALAIGRMLIAIIENNQTKDGAVVVPKALRKYLHLKEIVPNL